MKLPHIVNRTPRGQGNELRVLWDTYSGKSYLHCRIHYTDESGEMRPTRKGLSIPASLVPWLRAQLEEAESLGIEEGLIVPADYDNHDVVLPKSLQLSTAS